jgi:hypothetical protein
MAPDINDWDISPTLDADAQWLKTCLIEDQSIFSKESLWTTKPIDEVYRAFVKHPDFGDDDFLTCSNSECARIAGYFDHRTHCESAKLP